MQDTHQSQVRLDNLMCCVSRAGQNHIYTGCIYTVCLAGKSPNIRSYTVSYSILANPMHKLCNNWATTIGQRIIINPTETGVLPGFGKAHHIVAHQVVHQVFLVQHFSQFKGFTKGLQRG